MSKLLVSTATATLVAATAAAQAPAFKTATVPRLTVRPHEMATGTQTAKAGLTELVGFSGYYLYVPPSCVGTTRCPLILLLHGGGESGAMAIHKFSSLVA